MRGLKLLILLSIFLLFAIPSVQAGYDPFDDPYNPYTDPDSFRLFAYTVLSDPYAPKIACHPAGYHCLLMVYENNTFYGRGVKIWYSTDFFTTVWGRTEITSISTDYSAWGNYYNNYHFPYDVSWVGDEGKYYFFVENTMYSFDGSTVTTVGTFDGNQAGKKWGLGFCDDDSVLTFEAYNIAGTSATFSRLKGTVFNCGAYTIKANWDLTTYLRRCINSYDTTVETACGNNISALGTTGTYTSGLGSFPTDYTGLDYWDGTFILYQRGNNASWDVGTTDFVSYGSPNEIHTWGINVFNWTDTSITDKNRIWAYQKIRTSGDPTTSQGIWITNLALTPLRIWGEGYDIENKATDIVNISVTINATNVSGAGEDYVQTDTGLFVNLQTPNQEDNEIIINSFTYQPNLVRLPNFQISDNCWGVTNYIRTTSGKGFYKPYDFTVTIRDEFFGTVINGATVLLGSDEETTDVTGKAVFQDLFPIENPNMTIGSYEDYPEFRQYYTFTGAEKTYSLVATKSGYETLSETFKIANSPFDVDTDFISEKTFYLEPENTRVEVFVYSKDGVELSPSFVTVNITEGSNDTYWVLNNEWYHQSHANSIPALFYLLNNTGTFNITIEMEYFDTYNATVEVTVGSYHKVDFYLPYSSWELPCYSDGDCQNILCVGKFYKKLTGCVSNACTYQTIDCGSEANCDLNIGCVDLVSLTNCTKDQDCVNYCLDGFTMVDYKCGYDGFCKGVYVDCPDFCNQTLGYCNKYANCVLGQSQEFKVGFYQDGHFVGISQELTCDFSNADSYQCYNPNGYEIDLEQLEYWGLTFNDVRATPKGWKAEYGQDGNSLIFYAVSVYCNDECNMTWEYCPNGCAEDGQCKGIEDVIDDTYQYTSTVNDLWTGFVIVYNDVFPDIHSRSFLWFVYAIIIYLSLWWFKMKALPEKVTQISVGSHHEGDIIMFLVWFAIGSVFGQFYWFIWFGITVLAVYLFANFWIKRHGGKD